MVTDMAEPAIAVAAGLIVLVVVIIKLFFRRGKEVGQK